MKKKKNNLHNLSSSQKQVVSIEKAIVNAVVTTSVAVHEEKITEENYEKNLHSRLKEVKQKYGFHFLGEALPGIIKRMKEKPEITYSGKKIRLMYKYLEKFLEDDLGIKNLSES
ncbi:MAG: hypothetical protein GY853_01330 [PVC group bacterium]|nr:hypothetical protein [PVC group bacterium]